eukprot:GEZU01021510.1.p1 GENE.GEZU01021510.1~~GEZU01021510.1.p1  ORF type:complete len:121 (+),score=20.39 GEZU01021510.1:56-418(+)
MRQTRQTSSSSAFLLLASLVSFIIVTLSSLSFSNGMAHALVVRNYTVDIALHVDECNATITETMTIDFSNSGQVYSSMTRKFPILDFHKVTFVSIESPTTSGTSLKSSVQIGNDYTIVWG